MPEIKCSIPFQRSFTLEEYRRIQAGFIPQAMEDKWFVFLEGDWVFFHRGWTGICIYQVKLEPDGNGFKVAETWSNRDPEQYHCDDVKHDAALLNWIIEYILLGNEDVVMPLPHR